jgi:ubiquinone/menaquinone biosynthesis C-methylase UbiE
MIYDETSNSKVAEVFNSNELYFQMVQRWHDLHGGLAVEPEVKRIIETQCQPGFCVLEAGSGSGNITNWFAARHSDVRFVGVDISRIGTRMACEKAPKNAKFLVADLKKLPFENNTINFAFSQSVLEHVVGWEDALAELYRVLLPEGDLLIRLGNAGTRNVSSPYQALLNYLLSRNRTHMKTPSFKLQDGNWSDHESNFDIQDISSDVLLGVLRRLDFSVSYFTTGTHSWRQSKNLKARLVSYLNFWPFNHLGFTTIVLAKKPKTSSLCIG